MTTTTKTEPLTSPSQVPPAKRFFQSLIEEDTDASGGVIIATGEANGKCVITHMTIASGSTLSFRILQEDGTTDLGPTIWLNGSSQMFWNMPEGMRIRNPTSNNDIKIAASGTGAVVVYINGYIEGNP